MFKKNEVDTISKKANREQALSFRMLKTLYATKNLTVNDESFESNLGLKLDNGEYNIMAGLLADKNDISIKVVVSNYGKHAFDIMPNYLNVTLPLSRTISSTDNAPDLVPGLNDSQMKIYSLLQNHPEYTIKDLFRESGLSDGYVRKILTELKKKDFIQRIGSNKAGYWSVRNSGAALALEERRQPLGVTDT